MRIRSRVGIACTAMAALVAAGNGVASANGDAAADALGAAMARVAFLRFPAFAALPDSSALDAPVMLHGRLTDTLGNPLSGARVLLAAWPSNDVLHELPIGGHF